MLQLGAATLPAFVTLKPAYAAETSILTCKVPLTTWVDKHGKPVAADKVNAFAPPTRPYTGEEIKEGVRPSGVMTTDGEYLTDEGWDAHLAYVRKLSQGKPGYTCLVSIKAGSFR